MAQSELPLPRARAVRTWPRPKLTLNTLLFGVLALLSVGMLLPLLWMIATALKGNDDIYSIPPQFIPRELHWQNFPDGMKAINFGRLLLNSLIITLLTTLGSVFSSMLVGYGLARIRFPGRQVWFYLFIGSMMLPGIVTLIPLFTLYVRIGWYDTWWPLIAPAFFGNPFFIFLARQYYLGIPFSFDEAAKMDGAGHWTVFWQIMVPLTRPVWVAMAIFAFQASWNEYLQPLVYLYSDDKWPLSVGIAALSGSFAGVATTKWNQFMATNLLYILPPLILFFSAQRYFMAGVGALGSTSQK
ncbi:carbohydrate ABC transporter permease [Deinococcus sp.]|uniref:carbohydrate ABC transporter permease n=1 Tax=Deinococcus sp. TaxID=47478 RepID=UPI003B5BA8EB